MVMSCSRMCMHAAAGARMKDWDKQEDSDDGFPDEDLQDVTDSDSEGSE